ncbi:Putative ribonuclease H protein At1g65750 [Linum perenne]
MVNRTAEDSARGRLEAVLWQEEALWLQKSRSKWVVEGDRNTNFFHMSTLRRRSFNRITRIKNGEGVWIESQPDLKILATEYFKEFYNSRGAASSFLQVCSPKSSGGLGLRSARELNQAFLMKLVWGVINRPNELWVKVLRSKYLKTSTDGWVLARKRGFSAIWRGMLKVWQNVENGLHWSIRNGNTARFWTDKWLDSGVVLIDKALNLDSIDPSIHVSDCCTPDGNWNLDFLVRYLQPSVIPQVIGMSTPKQNLGADCRVWGLEANGVFSIKSAYSLLKDIGANDSDSNWRHVWNWRGPNRIKHFIWLASHSRLLTNEERNPRHLTDQVMCPRCPNNVESISHVIRDCSFALQVWQLALPSAITHTDRQMEFLRWWRAKIADKDSNTTFGVTAWLIWKARNTLIFEDRVQTAAAIAEQCSLSRSKVSDDDDARPISKDNLAKKIMNRDMSDPNTIIITF